MEIKRGDIYFAELKRGVGSEQSGYRPVLIIQNDTGNKYSNTVIVAAVTSKTTKKNLPTHISIPKEVTKLSENSIVLLEQLRTLDKMRLGEYVCRLDQSIMEEIDQAIICSLGINLNQERKENSHALQEHGTQTNIHDTGQKESQPLPQ